MNLNDVCKFVVPLSHEERSKLIENLVRFNVMCQLHTGSFVSAHNLLKRLQTDDQLVSWLDNDKGRLLDICLGVKCELEFYVCFWKCFGLVPTLDAGCAFDFVAKSKKSILRIDVTHNVDTKESNDSAANFGGPSSWKIVFAEVKDGSIRLLSAKYKPSKTVKMGATTMSDFVPNKNQGFNCEYFIARHRWLNFIEHGKSEAAALAAISTAQTFYSVPRGMLYAQMLFYIRFRYLLKLVPALSCGDMTDFVGESDGQIVRYLILIETKNYVEHIFPYLQKRKVFGFNYKIAVFDILLREFQFYDSDDCDAIEPNHDLGNDCPF